MAQGALVCESLIKIHDHGRGNRALESVSVEVPAGGIFSLIVMHGAGKTTLVRILATQLEPSHGIATIDGLDEPSTYAAESAQSAAGIAHLSTSALAVDWAVLVGASLFLLLISVRKARQCEV